MKPNLSCSTSDKASLAQRATGQPLSNRHRAPELAAPAQSILPRTRAWSDGRLVDHLRARRFGVSTSLRSF